MNNHERYLLSLIAKAKNEKIEDFSDKEIKRVFRNTSHETKNIKEFKKMVRENISLLHVYLFDEDQLLKFIEEGN